MFMKQILNDSAVQIFLSFVGYFTLVSFTETANDSYGIINPTISKYLILLISSLFSYVLARISAKLDASLRFTDHLSRIIMRGVLISAIPIALFIQIGNIAYIFLLLLNSISFFIMFNSLYNDFRDFSPYYIGNTARTDKFLRKLFKKSFLPDYIITLIYVSIGLLIALYYHYA